MGQDRTYGRSFYSIHSVFSDLNLVEKAVESAAHDLGYSTTWSDPYQAEPISNKREAIGQYRERQVNLRQGWRTKGAIRIHYDQMDEELMRTSMLEFVRGPLAGLLNDRSDIGDFCDRFDFYLEIFENRLSTKEPEQGLVELAGNEDRLDQLFGQLENRFSQVEDGDESGSELD